VVTPEQLDIITSTVAAVNADGERFTACFYDQLFQVDPSSRTLFGSDLTDQRRKLLEELTFMAMAAQDLDAFEQRTRELGARHHGYGVGLHHYDAARRALMRCLADTLGAAWTPAAEEAWDHLFTLISETMLEGASGLLLDEA
jgi:hemoglobin-like flavoprotein